MSVGFERRRDQLGIYFDLPAWPRRIKIGVGVPYTKEAHQEYDRTLGKKVRGFIAGERWEDLLARFPDSEPLRAALASRLSGVNVTVVQLFDEYEQDYRVNNKRSLESLQSKLRVVRAYCAAQGIVHVTDCTTARMAAFRVWLIDQGYANASVNRHLAAIRGALNLGADNGRIDKSQVPAFKTMSEKGNQRTGFFEHHEVERLMCELPEHLRAAVYLGYRTGWRLDEILSRRKDDVVKLAQGEFLMLDTSKNGEDRMFPLFAFPELGALLDSQLVYIRRLEVESGRIIPWLFPNADARHQIGDRIQRFDKAFETACERAGLNLDPLTGKPRGQKRLFHDFRRTATRNLERLGLSAVEVMDLVGHKTLSMHLRYRGMKNTARLTEIGEKAAKGGKGSNVIDFVQHPSNKGSQEVQSIAGTTKN